MSKVVISGEEGLVRKCDHEEMRRNSVHREEDRRPEKWASRTMITITVIILCEE